MRAAWPIAALAAIAVAAPSAAKPKPLVIAPGGPDAAVVLLVPRLSTRYMIGLSAYDPVGRQLKGESVAGGWADTEIDRAKPDQSGWVVYIRKLKPGTYVFRDVTQQRTWGICFHAASYQFRLQPGQILYLGEFDGRAAVADLQRRAVASGQTVSTGGTLYHYFDDVPPPPLVQGSERNFAEVREQVAKTEPLATSPVERAQLSPAQFGTGSDLFGTQRLCGGWHKKKAKPPSPETRR